MLMSDLVVTDTCKIRVAGNSGVVIGFRSRADVILPDQVRFADEAIPVTSIGKILFQDPPIRSISIPQSVISIDDFAFSFCPRLTDVVFLPRCSTLALGDQAFSHCSSLGSFTLPRMTTHIGVGCFFRLLGAYHI
jgi:hypothetical protein